MGGRGEKRKEREGRKRGEGAVKGEGGEGKGALLISGQRGLFP